MKERLINKMKKIEEIVEGLVELIKEFINTYVDMFVEMKNEMLTTINKEVEGIKKLCNNIINKLRNNPMGDFKKLIEERTKQRTFDSKKNDFYKIIRKVRRIHMNLSKKAIITIVILIALAIVSMFIIGPYVSSAENMSGIIQSLDDKQGIAMKMTVVTTAISVGASFLPGGDALADKLSDLNTCMLIVLCVIFLEKYLLTLLGAATFKIIIPIAIALTIAAVIMNNDKARTAMAKFAIKIAIVGLGIFIAIPASVWVSDLVYDTYESSITQSIEEAEDTASSVKGAEDKNAFEKLVASIKGLTSDISNKINDLVETTAIILVTTCLIPILTVLFVFWLIKQILGVDIAPKLPLKSVKKLETKAEDKTLLTEGE